jgi:hypothetical protein
MPIESTTLFIPDNIEADADRGGWLCSGAFANDQADAVYSRRLGLFFRAEGAGVWDVDERVAIQGAIIPQDLVFTHGQSRTSVTVGTADVFLANAGLQGIYFVRDATPANPHQVPLLNLGKIVQHIVEQHCNISSTAFIVKDDGTGYTADPVGGWVDTTDIDTLTSTPVDVYTVRESTSIWQTLADIAANEFYVRYMSKDDAFHYKHHPQFDPAPPLPVFTLTRANMATRPEILYRQDVAVDQVQLYALTDEGQVLQSFWPAAIGTEGRRLKYTNLRCDTQARLDTLARRAYQWANREFTVKIAIPGALGLALELYDRLSVTYTGTAANGVSIAWASKKFWVQAIRVSRVGRFGAVSELTLEEEEGVAASVGP